MVIASDFEKLPYKFLIKRFGWQFLLFGTGVLIASGVLYGMDKNYENIHNVYHNIERLERRRERMVEKFLNDSAFHVVKDFIGKHSVESKNVKDFVHNLTKVLYFGTTKINASALIYHYNIKEKGMNFLEAFVLTLSTVTTVGWGHVIPVTSGAKAATAILAIFGIPLTLVMIVSGSQLMIRLTKDLVRKIFGVSRIDILYKPALGVFIILYILLTTGIIAKLEDLDYHNALWYSLMSLTTVGFGDVVQDSVIQFGQEAKQASLAIFQFFWLVFGFIFIGALILSFVYDNWGDNRHSNFHQIFKNKDEELVDDNEE